MDRETSIHNLLERIILLDENEEPTKLPMWLLESITNNFSEDMKIGDGGFAHVYKGVFRNHIVAVKKLKQSEKVDLQEAKFIQEVDSLMRVKHKNIVRFLGYCSDTQGNMQKHQGKNIMAEERQRFLCFEFMPKGSLDKYICDASRGLEWRTRYQIIKGICEGLHYLHQGKIVHSDLKPANILLDNNMAPKIADFGLSRCFDEEQTRTITLNVSGSLGYMAPECFSGVITFKSDIYSLGIIITEMLTGQKMHLQKEKVLESWSTRFQRSKGGTWLELVKLCAEICSECLEFDPAKRPITQRIIERLDELERSCGFTEAATQAVKDATGDGATAAGRGDVDVKLVHFDGPLSFTADELLEASAEIIKKSTYGTMYKAMLKGGSLVAVKRLKEEMVTKGNKEFETEAMVLGRIRHPNLLALRAYYLPQKVLVFDYMPKGSLSRLLSVFRAWDTPVDWETRMTIAKGTARGLAYLHDDMNIVHGNLTTSNVLLDEQNNPKISDFGLSSLMTAAANLNMLAAAAVRGYYTPDRLNLGVKADAKTDVYNLGVIILELLTGKSPPKSSGGMDLSQWVVSAVKEECTSEVFDRELMRDAAAGPVGDELRDTLKLALHCVDPEPLARPEAREVLRQLEQIRPGSDGSAGPSEEGDGAHLPPASAADDE